MLPETKPDTLASAAPVTEGGKRCHNISNGPHPPTRFSRTVRHEQDSHDPRDDFSRDSLLNENETLGFIVGMTKRSNPKIKQFYDLPTKHLFIMILELSNESSETGKRLEEEVPYRHSCQISI